MGAYASASDVAVLVQGLLGNQEIFSTSTSPTANAVNAFISSGCAVIETSLTSKGYSVPPGSTTAAWGMLRQLNAYYAAALAEMSRMAATVERGERTRGQVYMEMFENGLGKFLSMDLSQSGLSRGSSGKLYAGGISKSDKDTQVGDTDRVKPRFTREQFRFPGTLLPAEGTSAS